MPLTKEDWWLKLTPEQEEANAKEGMRRFLAGEKPWCSSALDESLTYGYGRLDDYGNWEFPVPPELVEKKNA